MKQMGKKCLKCRYERQSSDIAPDYECPKCGAIYAKVEAALHHENDSKSRSTAPKHGRKVKPISDTRSIKGFIEQFKSTSLWLKLFIASIFLLGGIAAAYNHMNPSMRGTFLNLIILGLFIVIWVALAKMMAKKTESMVIAAGGSFVLILIALAAIGSLVGLHHEKRELEEIRSAGFSSVEAFKQAKIRGFATKAALDEHNKIIAEKIKIQKEKRRQKKLADEKLAAEKKIQKANEKAIKDVNCKKDIQCLGDRNRISAAVYCDGEVEKLAKYDFEWTDGFFETKFSRFKWQNKPRMVVTYIGDKIKFQNGFGAYQIHTYECDFDTVNERVLAVRANPGRLK